MRIEIISTGDEVITGSIDDTNASYLSRELIDAGLQVDRRQTVGDSLHELISVFEDAGRKPGLVLVTGGLGPTNDDLTTEAAARVAGVPLELNEQWLDRMRFWFENRGRTMAKSNLKQAMLPKGALMINNPLGTACGFILKIRHGLFIFAPGVPKELKAMWESSIKEMVLSFTKDTVPRTHLIRLFLMGIGESNLAELLSKFKLPQGISIGDRAIYPLIELKLIGHNASDSDMFALLEQLMPTLAPYYVCRDSYSLLEILGQKQLKLEPVNAIDGLCRGYLLIHLQELCTNFISCSVLNTQEPMASQFKEQYERLIENIPEQNQIILLPYQADLIKDDEAKEKAQKELEAVEHTHPYHYLLSYNLNLSEAGERRNISGSLIFSLQDSIYQHGTYSRNRDFLAHLCCIELYKALVREPFLIPEDCTLTIVSTHDSLPHAPEA